jgi:glycosyltransferase involved in cell wall biosynthesis
MSKLIVEDSPRTHTLMVSDDVLGDKMAGPGIRYFHLGQILSRYTDLTLAIIPQNSRALAAIQAKLPDVTVIGYDRFDWNTLKEASQWAEVVIVSPFTVNYLPQFVDHPGALVLDGYDPLVSERLMDISSDDLDQQIAKWSKYLAALYNQYLLADFVICASERQRYWWFGKLELAGRINPLTFGEDRSLRNLVDVVPYGLPETPPKHTKPSVKGIWPGIEEDDVVLLWGGGLWPWLDPLTAVRAIKHLRKSNPELKLIFPGTIHPNQEMASMAPVRKTKTYEYAKEHGLLNSTIFFGEWVPYEEWQSVLLESDIALSLHHDSFETQLAFRSRMLEYFWAGVPVIATIGDSTSDLVIRYNLGKVVEYEDVDGVIQAIKDILKDSSVFQAGFARARQDLTWENAAEPLIRFCQNPRRAADRQGGSRLQLTHHDRRIRELETLVSDYQNGKFMRLMRRVQRLRSRWHQRKFRL